MSQVCYLAGRRAGFACPTASVQVGDNECAAHSLNVRPNRLGITAEVAPQVWVTGDDVKDFI